MERYTKLKRAVPTFETTASHIMSLFLHNWVILYVIPEYALLDNGTKFIRTFFESLWALLDTKHHLTTTE